LIKFNKLQKTCVSEKNNSNKRDKNILFIEENDKEIARAFIYFLKNDLKKNKNLVILKMFS